ncbi:F-box/kelch-repeat protein At2g44130-like [Impatiens glandulifera]|uniref:F-box/kelch-repeat protein At2g44130-like n=1 Tax=Impatiens glandulifera TaxID=253017 RepID=UPI001FB10568|nr:F-box/kelch-repeat protein At2g44130-like [Impatiens glandulifera]
MEEQTIDDLTEDLVLQCLARLHYKDILSASWVCRKWRRLLQTRHFYMIRKQLGYTNQLACFLHHTRSSPPDSNSVFKFVINVFDPMSREWNRLPPVPNFINDFYVSIQIASAEGKIVLICDGRGDLATSLFVWDFVTRRWWKGKDLPTIWPFFFAVGFDSQIFIVVYKGNKSNSVWAYDMRKDEWTELPQMSQKISWCHELKVIGDELCVLNGCNTKHINEHCAEVYHFQTGKWRLVERDLEQTIDSSSPYCYTTFDFHELRKELPELKSKFISHFSRVELGAQSLVMVTAVQNSRHDWEEILFMRSQYGKYERIQTVSSEAATYVLSSCCVEV